MTVLIYGLDDFADIFNQFAKFRPGSDAELAMRRT